MNNLASHVIENFEFIDNRYNKETILFENFINSIKNELNNKSSDEVNDGLTDSVIVYCPLLDVPIVSITEEVRIVVQFMTMQKEIKEYVHYTFIQNLVKSILESAVRYFGLQDATKYMLKIHGKEEYITSYVLFCDLKYIRDCVCLNINPIFVLIKVEHVNRHLSFYRIINNRSSFSDGKSNFAFVLDESNYKIIEQKKIVDVLKAIVDNRKNIKDAVKQNDKELFLYYCQAFRWNFKELTSLVLFIKYTPFLTYNEWMEWKENSIKMDQSSSINKTELDSIMKPLNNFMESCIKFCNCASTYFYWPFKLKEHLPVEIKYHNITSSKEKLRIYIESLSNLSHLMSHLNLELK